MANVFDQFDNGANPFDSFDSVTPEPKGATTQMDLVEGMRNLAPSAKNVVKDIITPLLYPIDSVEALLKLTAGLGQKVVLPSSETGEYEKYVDAVTQHIDDRYGSWGKFKTTLQQDPVGALVDIASLGVGGGGLAKAAIKGANRSVAKALPDDLPANMYQDVAKFSTTIDLDVADKITDTLLKHKILPNKAGVNKLKGMLDQFNSRVNALIDKAASNGTRIPRNAVFSEFRKLRKDLGGFKAEGVKDLAALNNYAREISQQISKYPKYITPRDLQEFKLDMYDKVNWNKVNNTGSAGSQTLEKMRKAAARGAKKAQFRAVPGLEKVNAQYADILETLDPLIRSAARSRNVNPVSLTESANVIAGSSLGGVPGAVTAGALSQLFSGLSRAKLAQGIYHAKRDVSPLYRPGAAEAAIAAVQTGRLSELLREENSN